MPAGAAAGAAAFSADCGAACEATSVSHACATAARQDAEERRHAVTAGQARAVAEEARAFHADVLKSAIDASGSTTSPTISSSARASSATSRSSSNEPGAQRGSSAVQGARRKAHGGGCWPSTRTAAKAAVQEEARPDGCNRVTAALAARRRVSRARRGSSVRHSQWTCTSWQQTHLAKVDTVSLVPDDVHAPAVRRRQAQGVSRRPRVRARNVRTGTRLRPCPAPQPCASLPPGARAGGVLREHGGASCWPPSARTIFPPPSAPPLTCKRAPMQAAACCAATHASQRPAWKRR